MSTTSCCTLWMHARATRILWSQRKRSAQPSPPRAVLTRLSSMYPVRFWQLSNVSTFHVFVSVQVANGLRIYFDKALRHMLLYAQEMEQAEKVQSPDRCQICSRKYIMPPTSGSSCQAYRRPCWLVQALSDGTTPSSVYGAEHLLRLFLKLPDLLPANQMSADDQLQLEMRLASFLKFLVKNEGLYFLSPGLPDQNATS